MNTQSKKHDLRSLINIDRVLSSSQIKIINNNLHENKLRNQDQMKQTVILLLPNNTEAELVLDVEPESLKDKILNFINYICINTHRFFRTKARCG